MRHLGRKLDPLGPIGTLTMAPFVKSGNQQFSRFMSYMILATCYRSIQNEHLSTLPLPSFTIRTPSPLLIRSNILIFNFESPKN